MKFNIILSGPGGELGRVQVESGFGDDYLDAPQWVPAIEQWVLADGDVIRIERVESSQSSGEAPMENGIKAQINRGKVRTVHGRTFHTLGEGVENE